jgi:hypothetical protein
VENSIIRNRIPSEKFSTRRDGIITNVIPRKTKNIVLRRNAISSCPRRLSRRGSAIFILLRVLTENQTFSFVFHLYGSFYCSASRNKLQRKIL